MANALYKIKETIKNVFRNLIARNRILLRTILWGVGGRSHCLGIKDWIQNEENWDSKSKYSSFKKLPEEERRKGSWKERIIAPHLFLFIYLKIMYLFTWLHWILVAAVGPLVTACKLLVAAYRTLTRGQTQVSCIGSAVCSHSTTGEAPGPIFLIYKMRMLLLINICIIVIVKHKWLSLVSEINYTSYYCQNLSTASFLRR